MISLTDVLIAWLLVVQWPLRHSDRYSRVRHHRRRCVWRGRPMRICRETRRRSTDNRHTTYTTGGCSSNPLVLSTWLVWPAYNRIITLCRKFCSFCRHFKPPKEPCNYQLWSHKIILSIPHQTQHDHRERCIAIGHRISCQWWQHHHP